MELIVGGKRIVMVPFVRNALRGSILGFVRELKGCKEGAEVEIRIRPR
jgi:pyruvate/2-oxoglutarate dehydrogenase complex dihydrolipoamide acyltransferase (E2) component